MAITRVTSGVDNALTSATSTLSLTVSGTDTVLVAMVEHQDGAMTGVTWNGTALTQIETEQSNGGNRNLSMWYISNPEDGTYNLVATRDSSTGRISCIGSVYDGVKQLVTVDASAVDTDTSTTATGTITIAESGSLSLFGVYDLVTASTNSTLVQDTLADGSLFDNIAATSGSFSMSTTGSSATWKSIVVSFSPVDDTKKASIDLESGSTQYLSVADSASLSVGTQFSVECWIKPESLTAAVLVGKRGGASDKSWMFKYSSTTLSSQVSSDGSTFDGDTSVTWAPAIATWYHVAVTFDGSGGANETKYYVNGIQLSTTQTPGIAGAFDGTGDLNIGREPDSGGSLFDGLIDDIRVWSDVRTAQEIQDNLDTELVGDEANLVGYWKLNNSLLDETSNNNDLTNNGSAVFSTDVQLFDNNTYSMDLELSSSQYLSITDASQTGLDIAGDCSFEAWVKIEQLPSTAASTFTIVSKRAATPTGYEFQIDNADKLVVVFWDSTGGNPRTKVISTAAVVAAGDVGAWVHLAGTVSVSTPTVVLYKNGLSVAVTNTETAATAIGTNSTLFAIGARAVPANYFDGLIDDVRVWSEVRSTTEIRQNMGVSSPVDGNTKLEGHWKMNDLTSGEMTDSSSNADESNPNHLALNASPVRDTDVGYVYDTFFPDGSPESTSVDGRTNNTNTTWAGTRDTDTTADSALDSETTPDARALLTGGNYTISRNHIIFDTSALPDTDTIDSATFSIAGNGTSPTDTDTTDLVLVSNTTSSNTAIATTEYDITKFGSTEFTDSRTTLAGWVATDGTYNDMTLNASGLANIDATGVSKFGLLIGRDFDDSAPTADNLIQWHSADNATGITVSPKLVVIHSAAGGAPAASTIYNVIMF